MFDGHTWGVNGIEPGHRPASHEHGADVMFADFYSRHLRTVYAYVLRRARHGEVADLVADVFTVAWRSFALIPEAPDDTLWLYGVARRVVQQHMRSQVRRVRLLAALRSDAIRQRGAIGVDSDLGTWSRQLIQTLKPKDQEVIRLVVWEELSHVEVAKVLGTTANAVAIRWHRSVQKLRKQVALHALDVGAPFQDDDRARHQGERR